MYGFGLTLMVVGALSFVLPIFYRQFILVSLIGLTGAGSAGARVVLFIIGMAIFSAAKNNEAKKLEDILAGNEPPKKTINNPFATITPTRPEAEFEPKSSQSNSASSMPTVNPDEGENMILKEDVTVEALSDVFKSAFMEINVTDELNFSVKGVIFPFFVSIKVDRERGIISFMDYNHLENTTLVQAALLCNKANMSYVLSRFYTLEHQGEVVVAHQCDQSFDKGLSPHQMIENFRRFEKIAGDSMAQIFTAYMKR